MKRKLLLLSICIFSISGLFAASGGEDQCKLVIDSLVWDFGTIKSGTTVEHSFEIQNAGNAPLIIDIEIEGCSCLSASVGNKKVEPGKKTKITLTYESFGKGGKVERIVQLQTNDPAALVKELQVKGIVVGGNKK